MQADINPGDPSRKRERQRKIELQNSKRAKSALSPDVVYSETIQTLDLQDEMCW